MSSSDKLSCRCTSSGHAVHTATHQLVERRHEFPLNPSSDSGLHVWMAVLGLFRDLAFCNDINTLERCPSI